MKPVELIWLFGLTFGVAGVLKVLAAAMVSNYAVALASHASWLNLHRQIFGSFSAFLRRIREKAWCWTLQPRRSANGPNIREHTSTQLVSQHMSLFGRSEY